MIPTRSSVRHYSLLISMLALIVGTVGGWMNGIGAATHPRSSGAPDSTKANQINIRSSDLPKSAHWASSPTPASQVALGKTALACMKTTGDSAAMLSPDPFGTVGKPSGDVIADVSSKVFSTQGSLTMLPSASSEIVFVSSGAQAAADLAAFASTRVQSCEATLMEAVTAASSGGKATAKAITMPLPHFGNGNGGLHFRLTITGVNIPGKLYEDLYFYIQGTAEVALTFVNLSTPFSSQWANAIAKNVMIRARSING